MQEPQQPVRPAYDIDAEAARDVQNAIIQARGFDLFLQAIFEPRKTEQPE